MMMTELTAKGDRPRQTPGRRIKRRPKALHRVVYWWVWFGAAAVLIGCGPGNSTFQPYRPPTLHAPTPLSTQPPATPTPQPPTATPDCTNGLTYLEDLSIPDGLEVQPGEVLEKRWRVKNSGSCNWDQAYRLKLAGGVEMGAAPEQALLPARGGSEGVVQITFTAPLEAGVYQSAWQAYDPDGEAFGDIFYIEVVVP